MRFFKSILLCILLASCGELPAQQQALQIACTEAQVPVIFHAQTTSDGIRASGVDLQQVGEYQFTPVKVDQNGILHCKVIFTGNYISSDHEYTYSHKVVATFNFSATPTNPGFPELGVMPTYNYRYQQIAMDTQPTILENVITSRMTNEAVQDQQEQEQKEDEGISKLYQIADCKVWAPGPDGKPQCVIQQLPY
jgi:hypothetical protein